MYRNLLGSINSSYGFNNWIDVLQFERTPSVKSQQWSYPKANRSLMSHVESSYDTVIQYVMWSHA